MEILPTEHITFENSKKPKIFDNFLDFMVLAKSGKILIFEFKKNPLRTKDLKQAYEYYDRIHCKYKRDVNLIFIVISKDGKLKKYTTMDFTYHPRVIKTKKINKQKDLSIIRDKFIRDVKLTLVESSLLVLYLYLSLKRVKRKLHRKFASISKRKNTASLTRFSMRL